MLVFEYLLWCALLPAPVVVTWLWPAYRERRFSVQLPFLCRLERLTGETGRKPTSNADDARGQRSLGWLVWVLVVAALARPQWLDDPVTRTQPARDLLVAVDLSGSMDTQDFVSAKSGLAVERLTAVKQVLGDFLARRDGDRIALVVFGSAAFVQLPFTTDSVAVQQMLDETQVRMAGPRTAMGDAIGLAITLFDRSDLPERVMVLLTDGNDTGSQVPPERAAEIARDKGLVIHTIGVGDPSAAGEAELDEIVLEGIASITGGEYFFAGDQAELEQIYARLDTLAPRKTETLSHQPRRDLYHWPLGLALLISLAYHAIAALAARRKATATASAGVA